MKHICTVQLQDYYHHKVFEPFVSKRHWNRFDSQLKHDVEDTLALLSAYSVNATFFTLGWIAEQAPDLIQDIAREGHELASAGFWGVDRNSIDPTEFREDLRKGKQVLESVTGTEVVGFRSIRRSLTERDLWHLDLVAEEGYLYDSSLMPSATPWARRGYERGTFVRNTRRGDITELPHSTRQILGFAVPVGGGNFLRQLPERFTFGAFRNWDASANGPFVLYFHPWELEREQPQVSAFNGVTRIRQYRNLGKMRELLPRYFETAAFGTASEYLGLVPAEVSVDAGGGVVAVTEDCCSFDDAHTDADHTEVTVVIPCHNESRTLGFLERALSELSAAGTGRYCYDYILVDDKSTDDTLFQLQQRFSDRPGFRVVALAENRGVAGAIMAGIREAETELVCSMDADCSYDPLELIGMLPLLSDDTAMVTASPYHANGDVLGVPEWRLFLSRALSGVYRLFLNHKLATYTSCFRVYRRSSVLAMDVEYGDFRGILELLVKLDLAGERIVEYPTTLQSRLFGYSKMKTLRVIGRHLDMLTRLPRFKREAQHAQPEGATEHG
jgi:polysaccharide deacetylase family protein (PEP-CTERM system associated)